MRKAVVGATVVFAALSGFAQGTIWFDNRIVGSVVTRVYAPLGKAACLMCPPSSWRSQPSRPGSKAFHSSSERNPVVRSLTAVPVAHPYG